MVQRKLVPRNAIYVLGLTVGLTFAPDCSGAQKCSYGEWNEPRQVSARVVRYPSMAQLGVRTFIAGNELPSLLASPSVDSLLIALPLGGEALDPPPGRHAILYPLLATTGDSALVMIWGEPEPTSDRRLAAWPVMKQVWAASWTPRQGWMAPQLVLTDSINTWGAAEVSAPNVSENGIVHVAVANRRGLQYLRYDGHAWRADHVAGVHRASYASILGDASGSLVRIAYISSADGPANDINSVFMVTSTDGGASWSAPLLVSRSDESPAYEVRFHRGPAKRLGLAWMQDVDGDQQTDVLRHVTSSDGGRTWSQVRDIELPHGAQKPRSASDACGTMHVIFEDWGGGGRTGHLDYVRFTDSSWSPIQHMHPEQVSMSGNVVVVRPGALLMVFLSMDPSTRWTRAPTTRYKTLPIGVRMGDRSKD